jgi:hypothetical protein
MEARPFSIRSVLWGILDNLFHLFPLFLLFALLDLPLSLARSELEPSWEARLGIDLWYVATPLNAFTYFYAALVALAVWRRYRAESVRPWTLLACLPRCAPGLMLWGLMLALLFMGGVLVLSPLEDAALIYQLLAAQLFIAAIVLIWLVVPIVVVKRKAIHNAVIQSVTLVRRRYFRVLLIWFLVLVTGITLEIVYDWLPRLLEYDFEDEIVAWNTFRWVRLVMDAAFPPFVEVTAAVLYIALRRDEAWRQEQEEGAEAPSSA